MLWAISAAGVRVNTTSQDGATRPPGAFSTCCECGERFRSPRPADQSVRYARQEKSAPGGHAPPSNRGVSEFPYAAPADPLHHIDASFRINGERVRCEEDLGVFALHVRSRSFAT